MSTKTISIIYLLILMLCFIAMTVMSYAGEYNVETGTYQTETHGFENLKNFKTCVRDCMNKSGTTRTSGCMDDLDCAKCIDDCIDENGDPDTILIDRVMTDIDNECCFISTL